MPGTTRGCCRSCVLFQARVGCTSPAPERCCTSFGTRRLFIQTFRSGSAAASMRRRSRFSRLRSGRSLDREVYLLTHGRVLPELVGDRDLQRVLVWLER